ncbi:MULTISPECIES: succinate dehydrogenase, cytochrome b556 subunit [Cycloclasticus]|jgi:succinate dehydrogenase / fumarate reductase cytochrome b subunit|uniref:Succinate dehydrogenase cytochrome b556 subunit n=1 Tax=Cycloclasticus zancles 78-ME TaxID=1198232 RepID=S5TG96_9GAMM|nr:MULTISPECIES: succinate dehydrogenase, cytochrome b556 subunit [Cycloclasticus]AGS39862.1 Succinate dehydrogenase cytochrome b556 subunit [Cycloclasticus zancles 78-ME]MBV1899970.1 succinate dehydrogenase, cytochrome b556 subunit [Cycloclasticus sp.]MDF1828913.1 succinate dehydrogenase, cytochrome b556 subunit [Cycloclasticus pugetii]SHJ36535.1 succinate dehydrogenase subunit C [Cycloclasticus pugetii]
MSSNNRPLSPHLDVYRLPLSALLSIVHRGTGAFLTLGTLVLVWWLMALAGGEESFISAQQFMGSFIGRLVLFGWTFALFFHLSNGIRHLVWDAGYCFEKADVEKTSYIVLGLSAFLTIVVWIVAFSSGAGA